MHAVSFGESRTTNKVEPRTVADVEDAECPCATTSVCQARLDKDVLRLLEGAVCTVIACAKTLCKNTCRSVVGTNDSDAISHRLGGGGDDSRRIDG